METKYRTRPAIDELTGAQRIIDEVYSHIYEGLIFKVSGVSFSIGDGTDDDFLIRTPASPALVEILGVTLIGEGNPWLVELYEDPIVGAPGPPSSKPFLNMFRPSSNVASTIMYEASTITSDGTLLDQGAFGGATGQGNQGGSLGSGNFFFGWCLNPDSYYNIRIINDTGALATIGSDLYIRETTLPIGS